MSFVFSSVFPQQTMEKMIRTFFIAGLASITLAIAGCTAMTGMRVPPPALL